MVAGTSSISGQQINDDTDLFEMIIYTLSPVLGGRSEVLATPFVECLKYIELERQRKKADRWNRFMDLFYAHPMVDKNKRQRYVELIQPEKPRRNLTMRTNLDQLRALKEQQERERARKSIRQGG
ncbi:hypothetical protein PK21_gp20 [Geobacillus phage vB_GthS_PK2.1]|nr:hypothetical protein PK21_gp20 [Geobacillus phage vB_GthS_PK2.1]